MILLRLCMCGLVVKSRLFLSKNNLDKEMLEAAVSLVGMQSFILAAALVVVGGTNELIKYWVNNTGTEGSVIPGLEAKISHYVVKKARAITIFPIKYRHKATILLFLALRAGVSLLAVAMYTGGDVYWCVPVAAVFMVYLLRLLILEERHYQP